MGRIVFWTSITVLFMSLFEAAVLSNMTILPVIPDLVLLVVLYISFMNSSLIGTTTGFISGLLVDFLSASPIGLNAFTKTLTGFFAGKFSGSFNQNKILIPALMGFSATVFKAVITWFLSFFFGSNILIYRISGSSFWFEVIANTVCAPLIFALLGLFSVLFIDDNRQRK